MLPANPKALYLMIDGYNAGAQPRVNTYAAPLNILIVSFAIKTGATPTGAVRFVTPNGAAGTNLVADIAQVRAAGIQVWLGVGGAGNTMDWANQTELDAFVDSIKDINEQFGGSRTTNVIDGIVMNTFEGATFTSGPNLTYIAQELKDYYGDSFVVALPPAGGTVGAKHAEDRIAAAEMYLNGVLDWVVPQYYDGALQDTDANVEATIDFWNTQVSVGGTPVTIPKNILGIGYGIAALANYWTAAEAADNYELMVANDHTPKGAGNWAAHLDGGAFASTVAPVINNNPESIRGTVGCTNITGAQSITF